MFAHDSFFRRTHRRVWKGPELTADQRARLQLFVIRLLSADRETVTQTVRMDSSGRTLSVVTRRKKSPPRPSEVNAWMRVLVQLWESGLLLAAIKQRLYDLDGTVASPRAGDGRQSSSNPSMEW